MRLPLPRSHGFDAETACAALIGERAVGEAVAQHPAAAFQRRTNGLLDMVGPRCGEQQDLGARSPAIVIPAEQQLTNLLGAFAPARLARDEDVDSALLERFGEGSDLGRFANPLPAFEGNELASRIHAIPTSDLSPSQMRVKNPALPTSSPATSGVT